MELLVRNDVEDFDRWLKVFRAQGEAGSAAGLGVSKLWRSMDEPGTVFFVLTVEDRARAEAFMAAPESSDAGERAGVLAGEYHFLSPVDPDA